MSGTKTVYSLTETGGACCLVRGRRSGRKIQVEVEACTAAVDDPEFRTALQSANLEVQSGGAVWAALMPGVSCLLRWIPVPFSSVRKSSEVLPSLLDIQIPFPVEQCVFGVSRWVEEGGRRRAQVFAAREQDIQHVGASWLERVGADPQWVVHEGLVMNAAASLDLPVQPRQLMISTASDHLSGAFVQDGVVEQCFSVRISTADPVTVRDGLLQLVERFKAAFGDAFEADEALWFGSEPCSPESREVLQKLCTVSNGIRVADDAQVLPAKLLAAFVLGQEDGKLNFRQGRCTHPANQRQTERQLQFGRRALAVASSLWILVSVAGVILMNRAEASLRKDVAERAEGLAPGKRIFPGQEVLIVQRALEESRQERTRLLVFARGGLQSELSRIVTEAHRAQIRIQKLVLDSGRIELSADAESKRSAQDFLASIEPVTGSLMIQQGGGVDRFFFTAVGGGE